MIAKSVLLCNHFFIINKTLYIKKVIFFHYKKENALTKSLPKSVCKIKDTFLCFAFEVLVYLITSIKKLPIFTILGERARGG